MITLDKIKTFLADDADTKALEAVIKAESITADDVKTFVAVPENQSIRDFIAQKAIATHQEKETASREAWEKITTENITKKAYEDIKKEDQKTPAEIRLEQVEKELAEGNKRTAKADLKASILEVIKNDNLVIHDIEPFLNYGDQAIDKVKAYADSNKKLIDDAVLKITTEKFGGGNMPGGSKVPEGAQSTEDFLKDSGITN